MDGINDEFTADDISNAPRKVLLPIIAIVALMMVIGFIGINIDGRVSEMNHDNFVDGVRRGTKAYSKRYSMSNANLKTLAEGYLTSEDLDTSIYNIDSNPVNVDSDLANSYFYKILSGNTSIGEDVLRSYNIHMVHIYTIYNYNSQTGAIRNKYIVQVFNPNGTASAQTVCNTLDAVESYVEGVLNVDVDIASSVNQSIHKEQVYSRENEYTRGHKTVSTFNTYMAIGRDIPIKNRFTTQTINFAEIQTYSTGR